MTRTVQSISVAAIVLALAGCSTMTEPLVQFVNDSSMTTSIKTRLATDTRLGSMTGIGVTTTDDMVHLTGTVADDAEKERVESIARSIAGDNRVVSELRVAGTAGPRAQKE